MSARNSINTHIPASGAVASGGAPILERERLTAADFAAVAAGRALAIRIDGYYNAEDCNSIAARLLDTPLWATYSAETGAGGIGTIGESLFGCLGQELCPAYFESGQAMHGALRRAVHPLILPADRVLIELDHAWPFGAGLLHIGGRPAFFGLARMFKTGGEALPHTDRADWDYPCKETAAFRCQLFLNVYLAKTEAGGTLQLWNRRIETKAEYDALRLAEGHYALRRDRIGAPVAEIDVPVGSLVIADASKVHAVTQCRGSGTRLSVSGFIGYSGEHEPLRVFS